MPFGSRWTPIPAAEFGFQVITNTGAATSVLLKGALPNGVPKRANAMYMQATTGTGLSWSVNITAGQPLLNCLFAPGTQIVEVMDRNTINFLQVVRNADIAVQFFTDRIGSRL